MGKSRKIRFTDCDDFVQKDGKRLDKQGRKLIRQSRGVSFRCIHCATEVPTKAVGTAHRNHCPICLWSRHVDDSVGDRRSTCLSSMEPLGLSTKESGGELMIVHQCVVCGKIIRNRIAGDDNNFAIAKLFESSLLLSEEKNREIAKAGIQLCVDWEIVSRCLWGDATT